MASWQYWLGITKPKILKCLQYDLKHFQKVTTIFFYLVEFSTDWLPDWFLQLITARATSLIFSLFDIASARQVHFGIPQYIQCTYHGLTFVPMCPFLFADSPRYRFAVAQWLLYICKWESSVFSVMTGLIAEALLLLFFVCNG